MSPGGDWSIRAATRDAMAATVSGRCANTTTLSPGLERSMPSRRSASAAGLDPTREVDCTSVSVSSSSSSSVSSSPSAEPCARTCLCMNVHMFLRRVGTLHSGHVTVRALAPPPPRAELAAINLATQVLSKWCRHLNTVTLLPPRRSKQTAHSALGSLNCAAAAWTNASARLEWSRRWLIASRSLRMPISGSGSAKVLSEA